MKNILLTGAGGFLGRQFLWHIKDSKEYFVYAVTSNTKKLNEIITAPNVQVVEKGAEINWSNIDIVLHSAFSRAGETSGYITSLEYAKEIFYDAISNNVPAIINISSQSVYGKNPNIPWSEDADLMPNDSYGMAKASAEILLDGIAKGSATVVTNLRLSSIMLNARFVNVFVQNAIEGNPITIIGGTQKVSFMDIRDAVDGIIALVNVPISNWEKVYNLGTGKQNSIVEIAEIVKDVAKLYLKHNVTINIEKKEIPINSCMDINKFFSLTNWKAHYDIKDMIKSQFEYLLDNKQEANNSFSTRYPFTYKWQ